MKKKNLYIVLFLTFLLVMVPTVSASQFNLNFYPPTEPIYPEEMVEISGIHQLIPGNTLLEKILPDLWISQYTKIEVTEKPDWLTISFPNSTPLTYPDGVEYPISAFIAISKNAPMNTTGQINLSIVTGKFARTIVPWFPSLANEFDMDQAFQVKTGIWEVNTTNPINYDTKSEITNKGEGTNNFFILFIIIIILTILVAILWTTKRE